MQATIILTRGRKINVSSNDGERIDTMRKIEPEVTIEGETYQSSEIFRVDFGNSERQGNKVEFREYFPFSQEIKDFEEIFNTMIAQKPKHGPEYYGTNPLGLLPKEGAILDHLEETRILSRTKSGIWQIVDHSRLKGKVDISPYTDWEKKWKALRKKWAYEHEKKLEQEERVESLIEQTGYRSAAARSNHEKPYIKD